MIALNQTLRLDTGDLNAEIEQIYVDTRSSICSYLLYLGVPRNQAQELTQEVFLRLYQTMQKGKQIENLRAWLFRVAHNLGLKARSRERSFPIAEQNLDQITSTQVSAESQMIAKERNALVSAAMAKLSPQQRHCLYLRSEGLRYREIAEITGISSSSVNEFLRRAITHLSEAANG